MDPVMENDPRLQGLSHGEKRVKGGLFIYDKGIDLLDVQPLKSKEAVSMGKAIRQFKGRKTIQNVYSDNCPSLIEVLSDMGSITTSPNLGFRKRMVSWSQWSSLC